MHDADIADLREDFEELAFLLGEAENALSRFPSSVSKNPKNVSPEGRAAALSLCAEMQVAYRNLRKRLKKAREECRDDASVDQLIVTKRGLSDALRTRQGVLGAVLSSLDWQAPSFMHALRAEAGKQIGKIQGTINDYKRDQHLDAEAYEEMFIKEYIDTPIHLTPHAYATSSGMAAFTTVVSYLEHTGKITGPVLAGASIYFENKGILKDAFGEALRFAPEMNTATFVDAVRTHQPSAIFLDTISNTEEMAVPDLPSLVTQVHKVIRQPVFIVLDNSAAGITYQPLKDFPVLFTNIRLIVIESLNKFYEFGMDRVTGGIVWSVGPYVSGLFSARVHLGTNIPDASAIALPRPNRKVLSKRMGRLGRNALFLATELDAHIRSKDTPLEGVVYPGLPQHPCFSRDRSFHGAFFILSWKPGARTVPNYKKFLSLTIEEAARAKVHLTAGTSFGLNTTRVYLTALHADKNANPFIRISPGTETAGETERLAEALKRAVNRL